jgi:hypothetical protein
MTDRLASPAFRVLAPRASLLGTSDPDALQNLDTTLLPDGSLCWVQDQVTVYALHRDSTDAPSGTLIVAPGSGPGRWFVLGLGAAVGFAVPDIATLASIPSPADGAQIRVESVRSDWTFELGSVIVADGISVVSDPDNTGRWLRSLTPDLSWSYQGSWFVDAVAGDDESIGSTALAPLATFAEVERRLTGQLLQQDTDVQLLTDIPEYVRLDFLLESNPGGVPFRFLVRSTSAAWTTLAAGTITGFVAQATTPNGGNMHQITDATLAVDPALLIGKRVRLTGGANPNATGWVLKRLSATSFATGPFVANLDPLTQTSGALTAVTPAITDTFVVEDVPGVQGIDLTAKRYDLRLAATNYTLTIVVDSLAVQKDQSSLAAFQRGVAKTNVLSNTLAMVPFVSRSSVFAYGVQGNRSGYNGVLLRVPAGETLRLDVFAFVLGSLLSTDTSIATYLNGTINSSISEGVTVIVGFGVSAGGGIFDCPTDALRTTGGYGNGGAGVFGNGNAGYGAVIVGASRLAFQPNASRHTVLGALGAVKLGGQVFATWSQFGLADPFSLSNAADSQQVSGFASTYRTAVIANIASNNLFTSVPVKGLYVIDAYLAVVTAGAGGDTVTVNTTYTDDSKAETVGIFTAVSVAAKGFFRRRLIVETNGVNHVAFSLTYTKVGAPSCNLRLVVSQLQSAGT